MSDISSELIRLATKLEYSCDLPLARLCFLVDEDEWKELGEWMKSTQRINSEHPPLNLERMFIRRIEVRRK